jgi:hypothetical protein
VENAKKYILNSKHKHTGSSVSFMFWYGSKLKSLFCIAKSRGSQYFCLWKWKTNLDYKLALKHLVVKYLKYKNHQVFVRVP